MAHVAPNPSLSESWQVDSGSQQTRSLHVEIGFGNIAKGNRQKAGKFLVALHVVALSAEWAHYRCSYNDEGIGSISKVVWMRTNIIRNYTRVTAIVWVRSKRQFSARLMLVEK